MLHLITGGSGSGKSSYAEAQVMAAGPGPRIYIATMIPYGTEGRQRVERHRRLRREKQFETVERYTGLAELVLGGDKDAAGKPDCARRASAAVTEASSEAVSEGAAVFGAAGRERPLVLLECLSNLVANEMFEPTGAGTQTVEAVCKGVARLAEQSAQLFVVTNEIFSDGISYDGETTRYIAYLGEVNRTLAALADEVTEVVYGIPVRVKGNGKQARIRI